MRWLFALLCALLLAPISAAPRALPGLGAFSTPIAVTGQTAAGVPFQWTGTTTLAPVGSEAVRSLSGTGTLSGGPFPAGALTAPVAFPVSVSGKSYLWTGTVAVTVGSRSTISGVGSFVLGGVTPPPPVPVPPVPVPPVPVPPVPVPAPGNTINVRTMGVKGDGVTIDRSALNALIQSAPAHTTLYFPSGTYLTDDALKVYRSDLAFLGDGDTSIIKSVAGSYHFQVGHGAQPYTGISFAKLQFWGTPGQYMADGTARGGCLLFGCKGVSFTDCTFRGCAEPIVTAGPMGVTYGTAATNCRFFGWGRMCIFCSGGERIANCQLIQDDPNRLGERSSHGFYIHSGSSDVEVKDTEISGARKYAIQLYGENDPNPISNVRLLRLNIHDCANGIILAHGAATAGVATNAVIQDCTIANIYAGSSIAVKNGQGVTVQGNTINGNTGAGAGHTGAGIYLGVWAPYEPGFSLGNVTVSGNTVKNCDRGVWTLPSSGGTFTNCVITGNHVSGNNRDYDITGPGITWTPGSGAPSAPRGGAVGPVVSDLPPSNDSLQATAPTAAAAALNVGDTIVVGGVTYTIGATLVPSGTAPTPVPTPTPTPIPTPVPTPQPPTPGNVSISGIRNVATGLIVTTANNGDVLQMEGTGFGLAANGRIQLGGRLVPQIIKWTDTAIQFVAPSPGTTAFTGGWDLYQASAGGFALKATTPAFTIQPMTLPPAEPGNVGLLIGPVLDNKGVTLSGGPVDPHVTIMGLNFGPDKGEVLWQVQDCQVTRWTDTAIDVVLPWPFSVGYLTVIRPSGDYDSTAPPWENVADLPNLGKERAADGPKVRF